MSDQTNYESGVTEDATFDRVRKLVVASYSNIVAIASI